MPPFTAGSKISGTRPKYSVTIATSVPVSGGTTDAITMPEISACRISLRSQRSEMRMPSSSDVRSRIVVRRQLCTSVAPRNTPITMFVFPTSIAKSMVPMVPNGAWGA